MTRPAYLSGLEDENQDIGFGHSREKRCRVFQRCTSESVLEVDLPWPVLFHSALYNQEVNNSLLRLINTSIRVLAYRHFGISERMPNDGSIEEQRTVDVMKACSAIRNCAASSKHSNLSLVSTDFSSNQSSIDTHRRATPLSRLHKPQQVQGKHITEHHFHIAQLPTPSPKCKAPKLSPRKRTPKRTSQLLLKTLPRNSPSALLTPHHRPATTSCHLAQAPKRPHATTAPRAFPSSQPAPITTNATPTCPHVRARKPSARWPSCRPC
ncbi:hypothetical protein AOQ84DRAFT_205057 [Glonium stellatum]|uniref:Uncharacterized protein n=1 Tax=Glonium stellatum TaxID=574774 RepID=A0A8E2JVG5_9PEZI|nr:hypothetical protein AOQ84DRAFT_205057 [Glonium stellatum]